ncbi:MAG: hypothetical protein ACKV0T_13600 [Planctomycetales bacterium]
MTTVILACPSCQTDTPHQSSAVESAGGTSAAEGVAAGDPIVAGGVERVVQCGTCGARRMVPAGQALSQGVANPTASAMLAMLPALSQRSAHQRLEELLYDNRAAIEAAPGFRDLLTATGAVEIEMQDIKVQSYRHDGAGLLVEFNCFALGARGGEGARGFRIDGTGRCRVDERGGVEIQTMTGLIADC